MTDKEQRVIDGLQADWFCMINDCRTNTEEDNMRLLYDILVLNDKAIRMGIRDSIEPELISHLRDFLVGD